MDKLQRIKLIMNYDTKNTLNENLKVLNIINESMLDEAGGEFGLAQKLIDAGRDEAQKVKDLAIFFHVDEKVVREAMAKDSVELQKTFNKVAADEVRDQKAGLNAMGVEAKTISKQMAIKQILDSSGALNESDIVRIIEDIKKKNNIALNDIIKKGKFGVVNTGKITKYPVTLPDGTVVKNEAELLARIPPAAADPATASKISQTTAEELAKTDAALASDVAETAKKAEDNAKGSRWAKFKAVAGKMNGVWKLILGGATVWGVYALWNKYYPANDAKEKATFPPCAADLLDDAGTDVAVTTQGSPIIHAKQTGNAEYDKVGGLYFYTNGRVFTGDMKRRGTYSCQGGEIKTQTNENLINEQSAELTSQQMSQYVDDARSNLRGYVVLSDLKNLLGIMHLLTNKTFQGKSALNAFLEQYKGTYNDDFATTLNSVGVKNMGNAGYQLKSQILQYAKGGIGGDSNPQTGLGKINITWDGAGAATTTGSGNTGGGTATGDNTVKPTQEAIQYHDCSQKNLDNGDTLEIGCTSPLIKNIQDCLLSKNIQLKGGADSKFGPSLSAYLDGKKEIDKAEYDRLMAICADQKKADTTDANGDLSDMDTADSLAARDQANTPAQPELHHSPESSQAPKEAPANVVAPSAPEETGEQLFKKWVGTYFRNKLLGKKQAVGQNRLFFKGPDLTQADFDKLNQYLQQNGYQLSNDEHDKRYGDKYVWRKEGNQGQPAAAEPQQISEEFIKNIVGKHLRSKL